MTAPPSVSIVIPAYNEAAVIEKCLRAALDQTVPAHEIIVVDNLSTDSTRAIAERVAREHPAASIRVVQQNESQGITPTRNAGFRAARGEVLGRIDADSVIAPDWVARVGTALGDGDVAAVTGPVTYYDIPFRFAPPVSDDFARRAIRMLGRSYPFLFGCNMAIRGDAWRAVQGEVCADHDDLFHEDIDLAVHLHEAGHAVAYAPGMRAHVSARRLSSPPDAFRSYAERFERTYRSHRLEHLWHLRAPQLVLKGFYRWARVLTAIAPATRAVAA